MEDSSNYSSQIIDLYEPDDNLMEISPQSLGGSHDNFQLETSEHQTSRNLEYFDAVATKSNEDAHDDEIDDHDDDQDEHRPYSKLRTVGAAVLFTVGGIALAAKMLNDDDDLEDVGGFVQQNTGSSPSPPDGSQTVQASSAPPPGTTPSPSTPIPSIVMQQMACQAACNAAGAGAAAAAGAVAAGSAGVLASYVQHLYTFLIVLIFSHQYP